MKNLITPVLAMLFTLSSCGNLMFPMQVMKDDFDGATIVRQPPVVASRPTLTNDDTPQSLGFEWSSKTPDRIFITTALFEIQNIENVEFIADDQSIQGINPASTMTQFDTQKAESSSRRFSMPIGEFRKIAAARIVKMKITRINTYSVSRFGQDYPNVMVTDRFAPFLAKVDQIISGNPQQK